MNETRLSLIKGGTARRAQTWGLGKRALVGALLLSLAASLLLPAMPVCADNFDWRQLLYEGFEQGTGRWALDPGWALAEKEGGNHVLAGNGPALALLLGSAPWQDHRLLLRVNLLSGEFRLHLREAEGQAYVVSLRDSTLTLSRLHGDLTLLALADLEALLSGWHTLMVTLFEDHLMVALDAVERINYLDLSPIRQGTLALEILEGGHVEVDDLWITGLLPLPDTPPDPTRIALGEPGADGFVEVRGLPGAVPGSSVVYVANPQTLDFIATTAAEDGSFRARLLAPEGSTIQINYAFPGARPLFESIGLEGSPAILITVPLPSTGPNELPFAICERLNEGYWIARGALPKGDYQPGEAITATLRLRLETSRASQLNLAGFRMTIHLALQRLFDEQGRQLPPIRNLASAFLTPSGLPVEAEREVADPWLSEWIVPGEQFTRESRALAVAVPITLEIPAGLPAGIYSPRVKVAFWEQSGDSWQPVPFLQWDDNYAMLERQDRTRSYPWPLLPPLRIGAPQSPRIVWSLLSDYASNSERGVKANEDTHYALAPRTVFSTDRFIVPLKREDTGEPITYVLEPSLPLTSWGFRPFLERVLISPPSIPLAYPGGELQVLVTRPDGVTEDLGSAPFLCGLNPLMGYRPDEMDGTQRHRALRYGLGNPGPSDYYRAYTGREAFRYRFTQYGLHTITLRGRMFDIWGNSYQASGTYEVWVAHRLDLETGTLLGTPFEVGDAYSPVVRIQPPVPAYVDISLSLYINSSRDHVLRHRIQGRANLFGYFHPGLAQQPIRLSAPGEYDVLITASYWDEEGELWMGAVRGANVVETPGTPLVAHGERGIRSFAATKRPIWFAEGRDGNVVPGQTDGLFQERILGGALHLAYPYMIGDVMWLVDREGQNSIFPTITFDDTSGAIAGLLEERVPELATGAYYYGQFPVQLLPLDRRALGELPLVSTTSTGKRSGTYGWPVGQFPQLADQIGYFYSACVRPDVNVAFQVSESGLGNAYWFADDNYNLQFGVGVNGDLAPDFKINFGGVVFRDLTRGVNQYAIYASADVYIPVGDPMSNRVMPPFRGATGGPDGGPLLTLKGRDIDLFVHPTGVKPGTVLEVGDIFSFSAQVVPTLDSHVVVTVTMPSGRTRIISGRANKIGYFYDPLQDFPASEPGLYQVRVRGWHQGMTSAGPTYPPYPQGGVLGSDEGVFHVYVVERNNPPLALDLPESALVRPAKRLEIRGLLPENWQGAQVAYTVALSGFILQQGHLPVEGGRFTYAYDPVALHEDFPNLDISVQTEYLAFIPWDEPEMVDTVQLSFYATGWVGSRQVHRARSLTLQGAHLLAPEALYVRYLPLVVKG